MRFLRNTLSTVGLLAGFFAANGAAGDDWPNFRGPRYDGISREKGFITSWDGSPRKLWEQPLGEAYSSFACVGNRVYTCGTQERKQVLFCLDAENGDIVWSRAIEDEYRDSMGSGTRATPAVNDGRVYILGAKGRLLCCDAKTGSEVWSQTFRNAPQWGYSGSVLVEGERAIFSPGIGDGALRAVDKKSGKLIWKCGDDGAGYATPYPFEFGGKRYVCGFAANSAIVAEASTGREALSIPWQTDWKVNAASPIFQDGQLLLSSGYQTGAGLFRLRVKGGKLAADKVWKNKNMLTKFQSPVLWEGHLYVSDEKALKCVDFATGESRWEKKRVANGTIILADGQMILMTEKGTLQIGKAGTQEFQPTAEAQILGKCWTAPVLHEGRLYVRDMDKAVCLDLRAK